MLYYDLAINYRGFTLKSAVCICLLNAIFLLFSFNTVLHAEETVSIVSAKTVEHNIKEINDSTTVDEATKTKLLDRYEKTLGFLAADKKNRAAAAAYIRAIKKAPQETLKIREELEKQADKKTTSAIDRVTEKTSLDELQQLLLSEKANYASVQTKNNELIQQLSVESNRATEIRKRLTDINQQREQITAEEELLPADQSMELKQANEWFNKSRTAALQSEAKSLDQELLSQPVRLKYMNAQAEQFRYKLKWVSNTVTQLEEAVNLKRDTQAREAIEQAHQAKQQAAGKHPLIQQEADKNSELSQQIAKISERLSSLTKEEDEIHALTKRINSEFNSTKKKLEIAGLSQSLGPILLEQKNNLPDEHSFAKNEKSRDKQIARTGLLHLQHKDELLKMSDSEAYLEGLTLSLTEEKRQALRPDLENLANDRKALLKKMTGMESTYVRMLNDINFAEKNLQQGVRQYDTLLEKQLFWIRTATRVSWENIKKIPEHLMLFLFKDNWLNVYHSFISSLHDSTVRIWGVLFALILLLKSGRIKQLLIATGTELGKISTDKFSYTLKALFYTLILALPWPLITAFTGQQLKLSDDPSSFTLAVSAGLIWIVMPFFYLLFFRNMCLHGGLADIHFKWHKSIIQNLRRALGRLTITLLPALFLSTVVINQGFGTTHAGPERLILIVTFTALSLFFFRLLKRDNGILSPLIKKNPHSLLSRYYLLWLLLVLIFALDMLFMIILGYVYTAAIIMKNFIYTVWFVFALIFIQQLILRWLLLSRRKLALKAAIKRRQADQALKEAQQQSDEAVQQGSIELKEPKIDLINLSNDSNKLLKTLLIIIGVFGLAGIWSEVLPALTIFDDISLWHTTGIINGVEKMIPVTIGDIGLGLLVGLLTIIGAKQVPSILEIILLQQPSITSGSRYAIKTITSYVIIGIGTFATLNILGAEWSKLQWLFAALSVGIGFGLQEIVANFISGIILLFERPIRVGDYVSVGNNEGIVSKIQIRATTILTFDRKELLVPNKEFITGQVLNLTLSDPTSRLIIPVGVAYGSDIPKARELLILAALENERVLTEPAPRVLFYNFGDNTLDMQLRCYIGDVDQRLSVISELNEAINSKFNAAGISIAFPQRDVHLDIQQPIDIRLHKSMLTD